MNKTLRISFALKNTYRVNGILYALKQIPLLKKILPSSLYQVRGFKILANVLSVIWEVISVFLGKFLYFLLMIVLASTQYKTEDSAGLFLHLLVLLTLLGSFVNTYMFDPSRDKYYAMMLLNMNAREYTLVNYGYAIIKILIGFSLFGILFGLGAGLPLWQCILIPFFVSGIKITLAAISLWKYERKGEVTNENLMGKFQWIAILLFLAAAYGLPALGILIPKVVCLLIMAVCVVTGLFSVKKIWRFPYYREVYREILSNSITVSQNAQDAVKEQSYKKISTDVTIQSKRKGFEYLNELFIKRHRKILWKSVKRIAAISAAVFAVSIGLLWYFPEAKAEVNDLLLNAFPMTLFFMYAINRGTRFTGVLFINCDHSLLTYSFYKKPGYILQLFQIRLREIIKVNLLPAGVIGVGLALLLYVSGGTDNPVNYAVMIVSVLFQSIFFSVHYLTIYYLLQPYNAGTEIKSGMYQVITSVTYIVCYGVMKMKAPTLYFCLITIVFSVLYCIVASILVYKLAAKTFKIRT
ncbi:MAG: hypothetical protein E7287_01615 [Lachnospiraceae bacterium]|nr:hypothetical protein [Lachnospiraceae bacterium]